MSTTIMPSSSPVELVPPPPSNPRVYASHRSAPAQSTPSILSETPISSTSSPSSSYSFPSAPECSSMSTTAMKTKKRRNPFKLRPPPSTPSSSVCGTGEPGSSKRREVLLDVFNDKSSIFHPHSDVARVGHARTSSRSPPSPVVLATAKEERELGSSRSKPPARAPTHKELLVRLITTKKSTLNPITHRSGNKPIDVVVSDSTGHQVQNYGPGREAMSNHFLERKRKLREQADEKGKTSTLFKGVIAWLDGYTGPEFTNLQLKDIIQTNGGLISQYPGSHVTHILTSQCLSGSKTHAFLTKRKGWKPAIVRPGWVEECVRLGSRGSEARWAVVSAEPRVAQRRLDFGVTKKSAAVGGGGAEKKRKTEGGRAAVERSAPAVDNEVIVIDVD